MVGVVLLFVGAVLLVNGMGGLGRVELRSMAIMNFMVAGLALLATVILTDEDDYSREDNDFTIPSDDCDGVDWVQPVTRYMSALDTLKGARGRWATAVIAGQTACKSGFGDAKAAKRLQDFVKKTGATGVFSSICTGDLSTALQDALTTFNAACMNLPPLG